jgi:hypothetical protein
MAEDSKNISRELPDAAFEIEIFSGSFDSASASFQRKRFLWRFAQDDRACGTIILAISFVTIEIPRCTWDYGKSCARDKEKLLLRNQLQLIRGQDLSDLVAGVD